MVVVVRTWCVPVHYVRRWVVVVVMGPCGGKRQTSGVGRRGTRRETVSSRGAAEPVCVGGGVSEWDE